MGYLVQSNGMSTWKARKIAKASKGRSESGRSKGIIATPLERWMCRASRSYKHPMYDMIMSKMTGEKRIKGKK